MSGRFPNQLPVRMPIITVDIPQYKNNLKNFIPCGPKRNFLSINEQSAISIKPYPASETQKPKYKKKNGAR
jgi:hypothetical protein